MKKEWLEYLETPCLVIDMKKAEANIKSMQEEADQYGCLLRPHIKTHKMPLFARMQLSAGATGITCAKLSEAEVMADGGCNDIFIAYPLVGRLRLERAVMLQRRVKRLILAVDSWDGAEALNETAVKERICFEVRLEIDTGAKRTGVRQEKAAELAKRISEMQGLKLTGIYTFKGLNLRGEPTQDNAAAGKEEGMLLEKAAEAIRGAGIRIEEISGGSTPTGIEAARTGKLTEIRPGTYIFKDYMLCCEHAARQEEIAARFYATVVSVPCPEYAVIDGGTKTFPTDIVPQTAPYFYPGYAVVEGREDLSLCRMNEEHGMVVSRNGNTGLRVGGIISLIPIHVCTAVNMQNRVYLDYGDRLIAERVGARGMLF